MTTTKTRPVRLKDIADAAEISVSAASMALADHPQIGAETKRQVRSISEKLGYHSPSARRVTRTRTSQNAQLLKRIGFLLVGVKSDDQVNLPKIRKLSGILGDQDMRLEVRDIENALDPEKVTRQTRRFAKQLDGLIISGLASPQTYSAVSELHLPCVTLGHVMSEPVESNCANVNANVVTIDDTLAGRTAAGRLIAGGHKRIAFTCERLPPGLSHSRWLCGYKLAHLDAGLPIDDELITVTGHVFEGEDKAADKYLALKNPPTAHVVPDARIANALLQGYARQGANIEQKQIVIGGVLEVAKFFRMDKYPLIYGDETLMANAILSRLREIAAYHPADSTTLLLPFKTMNMEKIIENG